MILNRPATSTAAGAFTPDGVTIGVGPDGKAYVVGQAPTHAAAAPALAVAQFLLADGTYLTGLEAQAPLGITAGGAPTGGATPPAAPTLTVTSMQ